MPNRSILVAASLAAGLAVGTAAFAQDGVPASRPDPMAQPIPEGFVVPGPPPANAPATPDLAPAANPDPMARPIPEGFVLPGPPPTNAPAASADAPAPVPADGGTGGGDPGRPIDFALQGEAGAEDDWPCVQRRIDAITPAQVWQGPPLETASAVELTPDQLALVAELAARRLPIEEAEPRIADVMNALPAASREATATALFAELLDTLNAERIDIMNGIERYARRQKELAEKLRADNAAFDDLLDQPNVSAMAIEEESQSLLWDTRVFDERRQSLTYVCEVLLLIERRIGGLGRALAEAL